MEENDRRVRKHVRKLTELIPQANSSLQREVLKLLLKMSIQEKQEGKLFEHCVEIWKKPKIQPGTRYYAFKTLLKISEKHPELREEVLFLAEPHYINSLSPGIARSITKLVEGLTTKDIKYTMENSKG